MAIWRPVSGSIIRLDPSLASVADIEGFLAERRIVARGAAYGDDGYRLELAVTGRRRRVAILDEDGEVVAGPTLAEIVESMDDSLRKLQIDIGGIIAWGAIDLGEVDVEGDDIDPAGLAFQIGADPDVAAGSGSVDRFGDARGVGWADVGVDGDDVEGDLPDFGEGPLLVVSDVSFGALPGAAASLDTELAAFRVGGATAVVVENKPSSTSAPGAHANFALVMSVDPAGIDAPILTVRRDGTRLTWTWDDGLEKVPWVMGDEAASVFADGELGVGAFVGRIVDSMPEVGWEAVRDILTGPPERAPGALVAVLGLPCEVSDCLSGLIVARAIPGAVIFEPKPFGARLQSSVAHAVAGRGASEASLVKVYRKLYLKNPRLTEVVASVQAGVGVVALAGGIRSWRRPRGKVFSFLGGAFVVNALTRILTTQWVQAALRTEGLSVKEPDSAAGVEEGVEGRPVSVSEERP